MTAILVPTLAEPTPAWPWPMARRCAPNSIRQFANAEFASLEPVLTRYLAEAGLDGGRWRLRRGRRPGARRRGGDDQS